ncbi:nuclear transport factor 2 family protein [Sphingomonas sp. R647]|uniref:nuclear transport factor 2 family protein n=1 Tax=Sphingomonas sp. R647 TaxID=2875233 RepID=UPI001CD58331|nr:nuclear transport factor 2 family protein [Sphingomonas sp. R647]MCA1196425.1 nuclear transport factor 2 family protein [Sphingomonas sp. R647]
MTLALVGLSETPLAIATTAKDIAAVQSPIATVDRFHAALTEGKVEAALKPLSDDVLIYESGRSERSKAEYASHHLNADAEFAGATQRKLVNRTSWIGADTARVTTETETTGTFKGRALALTGTDTMILRWTAGVWKIVHIHWSSAAKR